MTNETPDQKPAIDVLTAISDRNNFYRDSYRKILLSLILSIFSIILLVSAIIYIVTNPPMPKYFATYSNGSLAPMIPLNQPNVSEASLLQWVTSAVISVNTFDFVNYRDQLQKASDYFTSDGWQDYLQALQSSRNLDAVIQKKLTVTAVATGAPVIVKGWLENGVIVWQIQLPVLITYQSASNYVAQNNIIILKVKRISTLLNANGLGIEDYVATAAAVSNAGSSNNTGM